MGQHAAKLFYGKYKFYDAKAPEFKTYETIKTLMKKDTKTKLTIRHMSRYSCSEFSVL